MSGTRGTKPADSRSLGQGRGPQARHVTSSTRGEAIAALDVGSTKIAFIIAVPTPTGVDVVGVGNVPNHALRKGVVVDIEATTEAIKKARDEAELMAGFSVDEVLVGISGSHLKSFDSKGIVAIADREVSQSDVDRVVEAAKTVAVPADRQVLHVLPREFKIDDQDGIRDPIGMAGVRLEASVHIVTGGFTAIQNLTKCAERAGLKIKEFVLESLASSYSVLSQDEKTLGAVVVDMGGGTSDILIYTQGSVAYSASLPIGGTHVTNDVAMGLRTPHSNAEALKKKFGCALASLVDPQETVEVEGVGGRQERTVLRQYLCEVIEPRVEETLNFINNEIQRSGLSPLVGSGIVITGGGSLLDGLIELGEFVFDMPVRRGLPRLMGGLTDAVKSPVYANSLGLVFYSISKNPPRFAEQKPEGLNLNPRMFVSKIKNLIDGAF